jgi:hypothetical protein
VIQFLQIKSHFHIYEKRLLKQAVLFIFTLILLYSLNLNFAKASSGVLRIHPTNSRYFTDNSGKAICFAGSHTWSVVFPARALPSKNAYRHPTDYDSFDKFLDFLQSYNQNYTRLWTGSSYLTAAKWPWQRTGPGLSRDGRPKFDMTAFD